MHDLFLTSTRGHFRSLVGLLVLGLCSTGFAFTKSGTTYSTDGSLTDVSNAITNATAGDVIQIPAGSFSWGTGGTFLALSKAVTIKGAGPSLTTITITDDAAPGFNGVLRITAAATIRDFKIQGPNTSLVIFISTISSGWRISNITYVPNGTNDCYFMRTSGTYGLIDNCNITGAAGNNELIFTLGPSNSWQTPNSLGTSDALYIEDCIFNGPGYVTDANAHSRIVIRYCTINGDMKVDGHGLASNGSRGVRQMEVYNNHWTQTAGVGSWMSMEIRGGTGMIFNNTADANGNRASFFLSDYGYLGAFGGFFSTFQTPLNYPISDQIGTGQDTTIAATAIPAYRLVRIVSVGTTDFTTIGAANNNIGTPFIATGPGTGTGTVSYSPSSEPMYVWNNQRNIATTENISAVNTAADTVTVANHGIPTATPVVIGGTTAPGGLTKASVTYFVRAVDANTLSFHATAGDANANANPIDLTTTGFQVTVTPTAILFGPYPRDIKVLPAAAMTQYQTETGNPSATFVERDIIQANRDFFADSGFDGTFTFNGSQGIGIGTKAQMLAITPTTAGVGFWVTDEGEWNTTHAGVDGQLYTWNGSSWVFKYKPFTYPHSLRAPTPPSNLMISSP